VLCKSLPLSIFPPNQSSNQPTKQTNKITNPVPPHPSSVTLTSILRVTSVQNSLKNREDQTWSFIERGVWTLIESNLGIICACLPVLKQPLGRLFPRLFGSTIRGRSGGVSGGSGFSGKAGSNKYYGRTSGSKTSSSAVHKSSHFATTTTSSTTSSTAEQQSNNPKFWRPAPLKHELSVSVSASRDYKYSGRRGSDEHYIFSSGGGGGSDGGHHHHHYSDDTASENIELGEHHRTTITVGKKGRISKTVEVTRTSFHEEVR
jgi:hypothetical protein